ncbi:MAG: DNA adenine methylase [Ferrovibrio sp.]
MKLEADTSLLEGEILVPPLKWAGGKRWFVENHRKLLPEKYERYIEPFVGSGALFFSLKPNQAILSDTNKELICFYEQLRASPIELFNKLKAHHRKHSKEYYYKIRSSKPTSALGQAARFIYLNRTCWNGLYRVNLKGEFNVPIGTKTSAILDTDNFTLASELLKRAKLYTSDFEAIIDKARKNDFIFVDPPYTVKHNKNGFIKYNQHLFSWDDQIRLSKSLIRAAERGAKVLLLNANHTSVRNLYSSYGRRVTLERSSVLAANSQRRGSTEELAVQIW